ncbi:MAG TPA: flagellar biosynthetic protein FliR, partial [Candidatus Dormibacteraeota bacterium]|nr:flagellar biosynthetic protein FliR [Candidatus Dormibacteraeota bacterium]
MLEMINISSIPIFLLVLVRVLAFFVTLPLFSYRTIPNQFKIGLAFFLAFIMFYHIDFSNVNVGE